MDDQDKTKEQLTADLAALRRQVAALQESEERYHTLVESQELLKESELHYRELIANHGGGLGIVDAQEHFTFVNPAGEQIFGVPQGSLVGRSLREFTTQDQYARVLDQTKKRQAGVNSTYELEIVRPDGETRCLLVTGVPRLDKTGQFIGTLGLFFDITERKRADDALWQSEEQYRKLVDTCPDAVVMTDLSGKILLASRQTWGLLGLADSTELIGQSMFDYIVEKDRGRLAANLADLVSVGLRRDTEYEALRRDGRMVPIELSSAVIADAEGRPRAVMAIIRDISQRKHAKRMLERQQKTLKHLLQSSDHERQTIAYEIHDGLAQYLTGAIMQFEVYDHLKEARPKEAGEAYHAGMTMLRQGHVEARRLISGVRPPILDEAGVVAAISHLVNEQKRQKGPKIGFQSSVEFDRLVPILENAIYRIVQEALTNAWKHSNSSKVLVQLVQHGDRLRIEIQDRGIGFKPEDIGEGRFGLAGIRERARLLGGKATIDSKLGKGTRLVVELPIVLRGEEDEKPG